MGGKRGWGDGDGSGGGTGVHKAGLMTGEEGSAAPATRFPFPLSLFLPFPNIGASSTIPESGVSAGGVGGGVDWGATDSETASTRFPLPLPLPLDFFFPSSGVEGCSSAAGTGVGARGGGVGGMAGRGIGFRAWEVAAIS